MTERSRTYLDWNATAPLSAAARAAMLGALDVTGNPSSPHGEGRRARALVEAAREQVGRAFGVRARDVYFTSGATEAANWVLTPGARASRGAAPCSLLLVGATEHACVRDGHRFPADAVADIPVDANGLVDVDALVDRVAEHTSRRGRGSVMVALQAANNETGVVQPLAVVHAALAPYGAVLVSDAVQAAGRLEAPPQAHVSFVSAHKLGGPKGIGAVLVHDPDLAPEPLLRGGGQERRQRAGTENVVGIAGFAAAAAEATAQAARTAEHTRALRDLLEAGLKATEPATVVLGEGAPRLPNTTAFAVPGVAAETALIALDLAGVAVSAGSACASGKVAASHVPVAMGQAADVARAMLRISTGPTTSRQDIAHVLDAWRSFLHSRARRAVA